ncbi:MAG: hypothetical protein AAF443_07685 [Chlamydiota bacterium]
MVRVFLVAVFVFASSQIKAENCSDCPITDGADHKCYFGHPTWRRFHCDQIRQLRIRVKDLESVLSELEQENLTLKNRLKAVEERVGLFDENYD